MKVREIPDYRFAAYDAGVRFGRPGRRTTGFSSLVMPSAEPALLPRRRRNRPLGGATSPAAAIDRHSTGDASTIDASQRAPVSLKRSSNDASSAASAR